MLSGKGMFIWMIRFTEDGDVNKIADLVEAAGMTNVWIKVADGPGRYNIDPWGVDRVPGLVGALRMRGISVWGWQYVYGRYPDLEADMAIRRIQEFDLDGFVVNAEYEYKSAGATAAKRYMQRLRAALPDLPIGLSTYRFPSYHPEFPFDGFMEFCDFSAPQVYWKLAHNPGAQLERCVNEYSDLKYKLPVYPTGAAYHEDGWQPTVVEIVEFMDTCEALSLPGFNFWEMRGCRLYIPDGWNAINDFVTDDSEPIETGDGGQETGEDGGPVTGDGLRGTVLTKTLNIRTGPGTGFADVGDLVQGQVVPIYGVHGADIWALISKDPKLYAAIETGGVRYMAVSDGKSD